MKKSEHLNGLDACLQIGCVLESKTPSSIIRLGDREGAMLGFPEVTDARDTQRSLKGWFGDTALSQEQTLYIAESMRDAVRNADMVGIPRERQTKLHPHYQAVLDAIRHYDLLMPGAWTTDAALHRYLQFTLFFRHILQNRNFVGLITPRDIAATLQQTFSIEEIKTYFIKGQARYPGDRQTPHFPDDFEAIRSHLTVPYQGALFLVGAGGLGKVYCHWIKKKGGIGLDIGAIFDAWAGVKSRLVHPSHHIERYNETPQITLPEAIDRYNSYCDHFDIDTQRINVNDYVDLWKKSW